jgi:hypothetical protein
MQRYLKFQSHRSVPAMPTFFSTIRYSKHQIFVFSSSHPRVDCTSLQSIIVAIYHSARQINVNSESFMLSAECDDAPPDRLLHGSFIKRQSITVPQLWPHMNDPTAPQLMRQFSVDSVCEGVIGRDDESLFDGTVSVKSDHGISENATAEEDDEKNRAKEPKTTKKLAKQDQLPPRQSKRVRRNYVDQLT